jgi:FMN phosphatase YigB (HAD superfamily)
MVESDARRNARAAQVTPAPTERELDPRLEPAYVAVETGSIDLLSVDAFDTLLLRRVPTPVDAFVLLGARLMDEDLLASFVSPALFATARVEAEQRARRRRRHLGEFPEVTLSAIYDELPDSMLRVPRAELVGAELDVEADLVFSDDGMAALVRTARSRGVPVIVVSDTYLSAVQVGTLLAASGLAELADAEIFTSSDHGVGKSNGLFDLIVRKLEASPGRVLHVGDLEGPDVTAARASGLVALHLPLRSPELDDVMRRERFFGSAETISTLDRRAGDHGVSALRARFDGRGAPPECPAATREHWRVGATVFGPVFAGFGAWVAEQAAESGAHRVSCLMREGTLLAPMVEVGARRAGVDLEVAPLWLSRQLCARAAIRRCDYADLRIFVERLTPPTVSDLARTLGLGISDLGELAAHADGRLDDARLREDLIGRIGGDAQIRDQVIARATELRRRIVAYLERCRHPDDDRVMLVDLGWRATTQRLLSAVLAAEASQLGLAGRYLVTTDDVAHAALDGVDADGYLVRAGEPHAAASTIGRSPDVLEQLCLGPEGSVVDLDAVAQPVLERSQVPHRQIEEARAARAGILAFTTRYGEVVARGASGEHPGALVPMLRRILTRFLGDPTAHEVALFGGWVQDDNLGVSGQTALVASDLLHDGSYGDDAHLAEVDALWPAAIIARDTRRTKTSASGAIDETTVALYVDDGSGFSESRAIHREIPVNERGLSYVQMGIAAEGARKVRIDPVTMPAILRVDRIAVKLGIRSSADPVKLVFSSADDLARWELHDCEWLARGVLLATSSDPQLLLEIDASLAPRVYSVKASVAFSVLELPDTALDGDGHPHLLREAARGGIRGALATAQATVDEAWRAIELRLRTRTTLDE